MKTRIIFAVVCLAAVCASAQGLLRGRRMSRPEPLEPLLPFAEAVEKAKKGDAQGCYALAIHYAKGDEIEQDDEKAWFFLKEAAAADYGNAVFVDTICLEQSSVTVINSFNPNCRYYVNDTSFPYERGTRSLTNSAYVAAIRAGYERAFRLGVTAATNELARFERRLEAVNAEAKRRSDKARQKNDNAALAKSVLNVPIESMEEMDRRKVHEALFRLTRMSSQPIGSEDLPSLRRNPDIPTTTLWEAGGTNGLTFIVSHGLLGPGIRFSANKPPYAGRARFTIDKEGRIIKIEGWRKESK